MRLFSMGTTASLPLFFLLAADVVADDGDRQTVGDDLLDGGHAVDLHHHAIVLHAAAVA